MDVHEVSISGMGHEGEGVGRINGQAVFVPGALPGEKVLVKILEDKKSYLRGLLVEVLEQSLFRIEAPCRVFEDCGGCQLQHLSYQESLNWKRKHVEDVLLRIGKLEGVPVHPVLGMEQPWRYRNKVQLQVGEEGGRLVLGYFSHKTKRLVQFPDCLLVTREFNRLREFLQQWLNQKGVTPSQLQQVILRNSTSTGQIMVGFVGRMPNLSWDELVTGFPAVNSIILVERGKARLAAGNKTIREMIFGNKFDLSFESFTQVNPRQTEVLYEKVLEYAALTGSESVADVYCGIGTITLALARNALSAIGIEIVDEAIKDARSNAKLNSINNARFYAGAAEKILPKLAEQGVKAQVIVVDPPRKGCEIEALKALASMEPKRIVYVSCDPATLARDLGQLREFGYSTLEAQPVDMFPWTAHVETVVSLQGKNI